MTDQFIEGQCAWNMSVKYTLAALIKLTD